MLTGRAMRHSEPLAAAGRAARDKGTKGRRDAGMRSRRVLCYAALAMLGSFIGGCVTPRMEPRPPRDAREAVWRINRNLDAFEGALYCKASVSFRFRDANGADRRFIGQPATVIFEAPRCFYFDIKHTLAGSVAHIGSNDERYWMWADYSNTRKLWYGTWAALQDGLSKRLLVPPDQLLDALMMRPIPEQLPDGLYPLLERGANGQRLLFMEQDENGWPWARREIVLDKNPPYLPVEIVDRLEDGRVAMQATLGRYKRLDEAGPNAPYTPRRYVLKWELDNAEIDLDLSSVRYRTKDVPFCEFPYGWTGEVEELDLPPTEQPAGEMEGESDW